MAKLSNHGAELFRMESSVSGSEIGSTIRTTLVLMQDGAMLRKVDFLHSNPCLNHKSGWKLFRSFKWMDGKMSPERARAICESYQGTVFKLVSGISDFCPRVTTSRENQISSVD